MNAMSAVPSGEETGMNRTQFIRVIYSLRPLRLMSVALLCLCLGAVCHADIKSGTPREQVVQELGQPLGKMTIGRIETLTYPNGKEISLKDGRVEEIAVRRSMTNVVPWMAAEASNPRKSRANSAREAIRASDTGKASVTLLNGKQVELATKSMYVYWGLTTSQTHSLDLPKGVDVPFREIKSVRIDPAADKKSVTIHVETWNGVRISDDASTPWINIVGDHPAGRFTKPVIEIKSIDFSL
jgi:hypothetical protein